MKIGVDLDGVVVGLMTPYLEFHNERFSTNYVHSDITSHNFWDLMGISSDDAVDCLQDFFVTTDFDIVKARDGAIASLVELGKEHELVVITARPNVYTEKTLAWLDKYLPSVFSKVVFTNQCSRDSPDMKTTKSAICEQEGIEVFIEDFDKYLNECSVVCRNVLLFDQPWNQSAVLPANGVRVKSWSDVLERVNEIQSEIKE